MGGRKGRNTPLNPPLSADLENIMFSEIRSLNFTHRKTVNSSLQIEEYELKVSHFRFHF